VKILHTFNNVCKLIIAYSDLMTLSVNLYCMTNSDVIIIDPDNNKTAAKQLLNCCMFLLDDSVFAYYQFKVCVGISD